MRVGPYATHSLAPYGAESASRREGEMELRALVERWIREAARSWSAAAHWKMRAREAEREMGPSYSPVFNELTYGA